jgi:amidohydrolase
MTRLIALAVAVTVLAPSRSFAQETDTEKAAARDVIRKMTELEQSLDVPALVAKLTGANAERDRVVARAKELLDSELLAMADDIATHPEIGFQEKRSVDILTAWLRKHDFEVETGVANLPTAFVAKYHGSSGPPNLGVIVEYDALRGTSGPFHGDQHSAQGPVGLATAVAMAEFLSRSHTPGTVTVFGTPGEEMMPPVAKAAMHEAHVFDGMDVIVRSHAASQTSRPAAGFGTCCMNIDGVKYTFSGAPAHQLSSWNGRNALEAVIHLFNNIDAVRSSLRPETRIQGVITEGGAAPNVTPDRTAADFYVRYPDEIYLAQVSEFVDNAAKAAALATGTKVKIDHYGKDRDGITEATLAELSFAYMKKYGAGNVQPQPGKPQGFEETGSVSRDIPGIGVTAQSSDSPNHTYGMNDDNLKEIGHHGFAVDAQTMTAILFDFATHADYRAAVKKEFEGLKALFDEYLAALRKTYTVPTVGDPK